MCRTTLCKGSQFNGEHRFGVEVEQASLSSFPHFSSFLLSPPLLRPPRSAFARSIPKMATIEKRPLSSPPVKNHTLIHLISSLERELTPFIHFFILICSPLIHSTTGPTSSLSSSASPHSNYSPITLNQGSKRSFRRRNRNSSLILGSYTTPTSLDLYPSSFTGRRSIERRNSRGWRNQSFGLSSRWV